MQTVQLASNVVFGINLVGLVITIWGARRTWRAAKSTEALLAKVRADALAKLAPLPRPQMPPHVFAARNNRVPYTSLAQACAAIPLSERYAGLQVMVYTTDQFAWWPTNDLSDAAITLIKPIDQ